ncbi:MAG: hypothetical protein AAB493_02525 [Patescibacteria group bacterium]
MIYIFTGDDVKNKLISYEKFMKSVQSGVETFFVGKNDFNPVQIESFYSGSGLFFNKCIVVFSNIFENESMRDFILEKLEFMEKSNNIFVFLEGNLNKFITDAFKKARVKLNIFELSKEENEKFNNFLLANAFGQKDKLNLWIYFRQAMNRGVEMEALVGVLFWKAKNMILTKNFSKFSEKELKDFTSKLSYLLPEARKNDIDAEAVFEQFLLEAF